MIAIFMTLLAVGPIQGQTQTPSVEPIQIDLIRVDGAAIDQGVFVGQHVGLQLELWMDADFQQQQLVSLFRQPLDVPVEVRWLAAADVDAAAGNWSIAPFVGISARARTTGPARTPAPAPEPAHAPGTETTPSPQTPTRLASLVWNGQLYQAEVLADRLHQGRRQHGYRLRQWIAITGVGECTLPVAEIRYGYATRFRDDLINGRVAEDQKAGSQQGPMLNLAASAVPEEGRPMHNTGAVGRFGMTAKLRNDPKNLSLVVTLSGEGNWGAFAPPPWPVDSGFHCLGIAEAPAIQPGERSFVYDLHPLGSASTLPTVPWSYFDPSWPAGYRQLSTAAIALPEKLLASVIAEHGVAGAEGADSNGGAGNSNGPDSTEGADSDSSAEEADSSTGMTSTIITVLLLFPWALLAVVVWRVNNWRKKLLSKQRSSEQPFQIENQDHAQQWDADAQRLAKELALQLRCQPAALVCPNLEQRLVGVGLNDALANEAALTFECLIAARYGGPSGTQLTVALDPLLAKLRAASNQS
jgi:hypothetical protein